MKTKPIRGLAAAAVVLAVIGLVFSGVQTASTAQPQTDEIATVVARTVEAMISPTPPARVENVETAIAGTLEAGQFWNIPAPSATPPAPPKPAIELDDFIIEFFDSGQGWGDFELPTILLPTPSWPTVP